MTELPQTLRPGVFTCTSTVPACLGKSRGGAAAAAQADAGEPGKAVRIESREQAQEFGIESPLCRMASILLEAGVSPVWAVPAGEDYAAAYAACEGLSDVIAVTGDGGMQELCRHVERCCENGRERIGILPAEGVKAACTAAKAANNPHIAVVCDGGNKTEETAAAFTAAVVSAPAGANLNGEALPLEEFDGRLSDSEVESLLKCGVTPVEYADETAVAVRAVTSCTSALGRQTRAYSSLSATLAADDVVRTIRQAVRLRLKGMKNTPVTRESIASQIVVELENKQAQGVIDCYLPPVVRAHSADPAVCMVTLQFQAAPEMSQIVISAQILL